MSQISSVSLRCINYNNSLVAVYRGGLILETTTKPTKETALWTVEYGSPSWKLFNSASSVCLTFNTKSKLINSSQENGSTYKKSLEVKHDDCRLQFRLSLTAVGNKLSLELLAENEPSCKASAVFFVREGFDQTFREIGKDFFSIHPNTAKTIADLVGNYYDYVVIGSSFCSLAFIHRTLHNEPEAKIIVLERGLKYLPEHHQQCPPSSTPGEVESRPWTISNETIQNEFVKNVHGQIPLLGGRSTYWSGWSPTPSIKELDGWPEDLKTSLLETYFDLAHEFLGVIDANQMNIQENGNFLYDIFQNSLRTCLDSATSIESVEQVLHGSLAMGNNRFIKFSTPEMLLSKKNVSVIFDCTVEKILHDGKKATALQTSQGIPLPLNDSKLILAMSTLPATTLVLNSFKNTEFPQISHVGKRFTAHFVSSVVARVPRQYLSLAENAPEVELGAVYITGMKDKAQYHLQLSGVTYTQCKDSSSIHGICKKYSANSIPRECLDITQNFAVVSCSTLGELDYKNKSNQFNLIKNCQSLIDNGELKLCLNDQDNKLWDLMDSVTFKVMSKLSPTENSDALEYWHETDKTWRQDAPPREQIRKKFLVHDASTMWIGDSTNTEAPVDLDYHIQCVNNVYITGGALWPTGGSWNPVLTIVAMAMHLADSIYKNARC
ncbi:unnamed protein product [Rotaria socialis]|uniref:Uncharacterized protein n=1 Tax=Rotaria socialis TaxID=392032 RepID=A0A818LQN2_9BILA|nr:unnamed protein product [Rotaria socialis]CAF3573775.1 unnamed protein product [Rotaria socialis]CAF4441591.1 unnamed protein product [Rotaria socialis]CAF4616706.1 unnamed protein product [Rotaria socialis]